MASGNSKRGVIAILTGGGDVPGLNPAIRAGTIRAVREGYDVIGLRRGWASLVDMVRDKDGNAACLMMAELCAWAKGRGKTVTEYLDGFESDSRDP